MYKVEFNLDFIHKASILEMFINSKTVIIITMPLANIYFDKEEDDNVADYSKKWKLSKTETIKRIVREFGKE